LQGSIGDGLPTASSVLLRVSSGLDYIDTESKNGSILQRQALWDTKFDGGMDLRQTEMINGATQSFFATRERFLDGGWRVVWTRSGRTQEDQSPADCDGLSGFPDNVEGSSINPLGPGQGNVQIVKNGQPGACSDGDALKLARAVRNAVADIQCLKDLNPGFALQLEEALAEHQLKIACGNRCAGTNATTDTGGSWIGMITDRPWSYYRSNVNPGRTLSDDRVAEQIMLHELMHFAGIKHAGDESGNGGTDEIYSCGRHCAKCGSYGLGGSSADADLAKDCAACADAANKNKCGRETADVQTCEPNYTVCHGAIGVNRLCDDCLQSEPRYCDHSSIPGALRTAFCCLRCPTDAPRNDIDCRGRTPGVTRPCPKPSSCPR